MQDFLDIQSYPAKQDFSNCFEPLYLPAAPSPPQQTISISSFRIPTFTSFDDVNSKKPAGI